MDSVKFDTNKHSVYLLYYYLVLTTSRRRELINHKVSQRLREIFEDIQDGHKITLLEWVYDKDYVRILFKATPTSSLYKFINAYKSASSRLIKKEFPELRQKLLAGDFWAKSYCLLTMGEAPLELVEKYIEVQGRRNVKSL